MTQINWEFLRSINSSTEWATFLAEQGIPTDEHRSILRRTSSLVQNDCSHNGTSYFPLFMRTLFSLIQYPNTPHTHVAHFRVPVNSIPWLRSACDTPVQLYDIQQLYFAHVSKNIIASFEYLDEQYANDDHKNISIGLMQNRFNKVRTYMYGNRIIVISNQEFTAEIVQKFCAVLPVLRPDRFEDNEELIEIFRALAQPTPEKFLELLVAYLKQTTFAKDERIRNFQEVFRKAQDGRVKQLTGNISSYQRQAEQLTDSLHQAFSIIKDNELKLFNLTYNNEAKYNELMEAAQYYANKPGVFDVGITTEDNFRIILTVQTPVIYYDEEAAAAVLNSPRSPFTEYQGNDGLYMQILKDIFINHKLTIYFSGEVALDLTTGTIRYRHPRSSLGVNGVPNPHLAHYDCWGTNKPEIIKAMDKQDYIMILEQVMAAIGGLNFLDGAVMSRWADDTWQYFEGRSATNPFIQLESGEMVTLWEYRARLEATSVDNEN